MRKTLLLGLLLAAVAASPGAARPDAQPSIRVVAHAPVVVTGSSFRARERVRVTVAVLKVTRVATVRATARGTFRLAFALSAQDPCNVRASAVGSSGAKAAWRMSERMCLAEGAGEGFGGG